MQATPTLLRRVLWADAATSIACGAIQVGALDTLSRVLALPSALLFETGVFYLAYGAVVGWTASRAEPPRPLVLLFAFGNIGWALLCAAALAGPWLHPSFAGGAWIALQALAVFAFGELQWWCSRRPRAALA